MCSSISFSYNQTGACSVTYLATDSYCCEEIFSETRKMYVYSSFSENFSSNRQKFTTLFCAARRPIHCWRWRDDGRTARDHECLRGQMTTRAFCNLCMRAKTDRWSTYSRNFPKSLCIRLTSSVSILERDKWVPNAHWDISLSPLQRTSFDKEWL